MEKHKIDICAISETKRKGKGNIAYPGYILQYSGKEKSERAKTEVGILIREKYRQNIEDVQYINERIIRVMLNIGKERIHFISVYSPDTSKSKEEIDNFYEQLQAEMDKIPGDQKTLILGDLNAKIRDAIVDGIKQKYDEPHTNSNGHMLIEFCVQNEIRINNTYFNHKPQHKITWTNSRGQTSMIDYIISNRVVHSSQIIDIRSLTSANIGSNHCLVLSKMRSL